MNVLIYLTFLKFVSGQNNSFSNLLPDLLKPLIASFNGTGISEIQESYQKILNKLSKFQGLLEDDSPCFAQLRLFAEGLALGDLWALQMLDATAKPQAGILYGNTMHIGNYDECLKIREPLSTEGDEIRAQYCTVLISKHNGSHITETKAEAMIDDLMKYRFTYGLCIPSVCSAKELQHITDTLEEFLKSPIHFTFMDKFCNWESKTTPMFTRTIIALTVFSGIGFLLFLGTLEDIFRIWDGAGSKWITPFSVYSNSKKLFHIASRTDDNLNCLDGLRVISMMWMVTAHRFLGGMGVPTINIVVLKEWQHQWYNMLIVGSGLGVDTFFVISGLLVVYVFLKSEQKGSKLSIPVLYLNRILRLSPSLIMVVLVYATLLQYLEFDLAPVIDQTFGAQCRRNWWSTLLYVQNYVNPNDMCAVHTWYLGVDTQLYILAPLILLPIRTRPKTTITGIMILAILSITIAFEVSWLKHLGATFFDQTPEVYANLYTPTHIRAPPWLFGAITGYVIFKYRNEPVKVNKFLVLTIWFLVISSMLAILVSHMTFLDVEYNVLSSSIFNALARPAWSACICLVILLCTFGYGGMVDAFLSCTPFRILIRLNYSVYLIHMMVIMYLISRMKTPVHFSNISMFHQFWGDYVVTLIVSVAWTLAFESPMILIGKNLLSRNKQERRKSRSDVPIDKTSCETVIVR